MKTSEANKPLTRKHTLQFCSIAAAIICNKLDIQTDCKFS